MKPDLTIPHAVGEVVVHGINWQPWLRQESITAATIEEASLDSGLVVDSSAVEDTTTHQHFTVAGGVAGKTWRGVATITTTAGNTLKASIHIPVKEP